MTTFWEASQVAWLILNRPVFVVSNHNITLGTIVAVVGVAYAARRAAILTGEAVAAIMRRRALGDEGTIASIARLTQYGVLVIGGVIGAQVIGIDLGTLFTAGAVFAVGIGFALQDITQNFVSGVILLAERTIRPGDVVEFEGLVVRIRELGIRATRAETLDGAALIVPNRKLIQSHVHNYSLLRKPVRVRVMVGVAYGSDYREVHKVLTEAARPLFVLKEPVVALVEFGASSVDFEVSTWVLNAFEMQAATSDLAFAVAEGLATKGIEIAFPQLDIHLDR